jgi:hypothetical protein
MGQEVVDYEAFEPWCLDPNGQIHGVPVVGALVLHTSGDIVLTLSSRLRFSSVPLAGSPVFGLHVSAMTRDSWVLQRARWLERSQMSGPRQVSWYRHTTDASQAPFLPIPVGRRFAEITVRPGDHDAVALGFEGLGKPIVFEYRPDFDGGIGLAGTALTAPKVIAPFLPIGEFSWLHPAAKIPVQLEGDLLKSAVFEDWPLTLRRSIQGLQELPSGEPLRRSEQLLTAPHLRLPYLSIVEKLWALRFKQRPWLPHRLANFKITVAEDHAFGELVNRSLLARQALC